MARRLSPLAGTLLWAFSIVAAFAVGEKLWLEPGDHIANDATTTALAAGVGAYSARKPL